MGAVVVAHPCDGELEELAPVQLRGGLERFSGEQVVGAEVAWSRYAQMRYAGQGFEIHVDLPDGAIGPGYPDAAVAAFNAAYKARNKFLDDEGVVEAVDWSLVARLPQAGRRDVRPALAQKEGHSGSRTRPCWFPEAGGFAETQVLSRAALADGAVIDGPAVVEDPDCTVVVPPGDRLRMRDSGHLIIDIAKG